jgi:nucleotide-binding universal stress UspA family protein
MKTLLIPIDFSEACDNAVNYAVEFAKSKDLQMILLNVYDYPLVSSDPLIWVPSANELIEETLIRLQSIRDKMHKRYGEQLNVQCYCEPGTVIETINAFAKRHHADLIIMGMQGGGFVSEKIIGSITASLMRKSVCPVLGIPKRVKFHSLSQIVLGTDYDDAQYTKVLRPLKELIRLFDAHLFVLYVIEPTIETPKKIVTSASVAKGLEGIPYTAHTVVHVDFASAIDQFTEDKAIDLAVIIPRKHSFFYSLFHEENTRKLAFHTDVPLLALHE